MKPILLTALFLLFSQFSSAASIDFSKTPNTGWYRSTIQTEDFLITKTKGWMGVNNQNVPNRNAYNGTTDLEIGYGKFTITQQSGDLFSLTSIDTAISWYNRFSIDELLITGFFTNGDTVSNLLNITHNYQSYLLTGFNDISHLVFSGKSLSHGYVAIDNLQILSADSASLTSVPEPISFHLLALGIIGLILSFHRNTSLQNK